MTDEGRKAAADGGYRPEGLGVALAERQTATIGRRVARPPFRDYTDVTSKGPETVNDLKTSASRLIFLVRYGDHVQLPDAFQPLRCYA